MESNIAPGMENDPWVTGEEGPDEDIEMTEEDIEDFDDENWETPESKEKSDDPLKDLGD